MPSKAKQHTLKVKSAPKTTVINKKEKRPSVNRKMWTEESVLCAMKAVEDGEDCHCCFGRRGNSLAKVGINLTCLVTS